MVLGFPDSSVGKESICTEGEPGSIPGLGISTGEEIGYPLQCCWASLVAQLVKNLPAMRETGFDPCVGKIPWNKWVVTHSSVLAWTGETGKLSSVGPQSDMIEWLSLSHSPILICVWSWSCQMWRTELVVFKHRKWFLPQRQKKYFQGNLMNL